MGDNETQALKEDVTEVKGTVKKVETAINNLHLLIVGKYVTKDDLTEHKKENDKAHDVLKGELEAATKGQVPGWLLVVLPIVSFTFTGLAVTLITMKEHLD